MNKVVPGQSSVITLNAWAGGDGGGSGGIRVEKMFCRFIFILCFHDVIYTSNLQKKCVISFFPPSARQTVLHKLDRLG